MKTQYVIYQYHICTLSITMSILYDLCIYIYTTDSPLCKGKNHEILVSNVFSAVISISCFCDKMTYI